MVLHLYIIIQMYTFMHKLEALLYLYDLIKNAVFISNIVPSTALTSDDLDTQMTPVQIMLLVAALFIYGRTFYTCS